MRPGLLRRWYQLARPTVQLSAAAVTPLGGRPLSSGREVLWSPTPESMAQSNLTEFADLAERRFGRSFDSNYERIWQWSVDHPAEFWGLLWEWAGVVASQPYSDVVDDVAKMPGAEWFTGSRLNFAENLLRHRLTDRQHAPAIEFYAEGAEVPTVTLSYQQLADEVAVVASSLRQLGIVPGDRVAGLLPNSPDAVVAMLAATSLGAVWSSCSPDFGNQGVLDRFAQIKPRVLFACDKYAYRGRVHDTLARLPYLVDHMPTVEQCVVVPSAGMPAHTSDVTVSDVRGGISLEHFKAQSTPPDAPPPPLVFEQLPFTHPVVIMFSSGTTGLPKCMVQGPGVLVKHLCEHLLLVDVKPTDRVFFYTTTGWMMWNWITSALATGATVVSYEGDPMYPDAARLWRLADEGQVNVFGTSARFLSAQMTAGVVPKNTADLRGMRSLLSTGSPAGGNVFEYTRDAVGPHVQFGSITGGTDLNGLFAGCTPLKGVINGEIQSRSLGMAMAIYDDAGEEVIGQQGELVCRQAFPSMPLYFWEDENDARYLESYFEEFDGVWCHGDFGEVTPDGGVIIHGRSDATLNPGGVRIGTADLYRVVETQVAEAEDSLVVGQDYTLEDGTPDVRILLFVKLKDGIPEQALSPGSDLEKDIKSKIRDGCTPRHVPARVIACPAIPYTTNGKKVEIAVKKTMMGKPVTNLSSLRNPEALDWFKLAK